VHALSEFGAPRQQPAPHVTQIVDVCAIHGSQRHMPSVGLPFA
jgi:hypothetical protein